MNFLELFFVTLIWFAFVNNSKFEDLSPCSKYPCRNPAECENLTNGSFVCHCKQGTGGRYCEKLLEIGDNLCLSSPCWYGGVCSGNKTHWNCLCPENRAGLNCKNSTQNQDFMVKIKNKGFYLAKMTLIFKTFPVGNLNRITKSIAIGQEHAFKLPFNTDFLSTYLIVHAIAGIQVMMVKINSTPRCFHVWGTTFYPNWSFVDCW